jgi:hypothetical protein
MAFYDDVRSSVEVLVQVFMDWFDGNRYWKKKEVRTPLGLLSFLNSLGGRLLEVGFFFGIAWSFWARRPCSASTSDAEWLSCSWNAILPSALVLLLGVVYNASRRSAKVELSQATMVFPINRVPDRWVVETDETGIILSVILFFALYVAMASMADRIVVVSAIMLVISCIDWNTRRLINDRVEAYFNDPQYAPTPEDPEYRLIEERCVIIRQFLYYNPHLLKEAGRVAGCAGAFGIGLASYAYSIEWARILAYFVLAATLVINERITWRWRARRDKAWLAAENETPIRISIPFNVAVWTASTLVVALCGIVSWNEGTFTSRSITMGFANHGGMWGDFLILPIVNGLIAAQLPRISTKRLAILAALFVGAALLSVVIHQQWAGIGQSLRITDDVFPSHDSGVWYRDISRAGLLHVVYMSIELCLVFVYVASAMPVTTVLFVSTLLTVHLALGQVQPSWYTTGEIWTARTMVPFLSTVALTWMVSLYKVRRSYR